MNNVSKVYKLNNSRKYVIGYYALMILMIAFIGIMHCLALLRETDYSRIALTVTFFYLAASVSVPFMMENIGLNKTMKMMSVLPFRNIDYRKLRFRPRLITMLVYLCIIIGYNSVFFYNENIIKAKGYMGVYSIMLLFMLVMGYIIENCDVKSKYINSLTIAFALIEMGSLCILFLMFIMGQKAANLFEFFNIVLGWFVGVPCIIASIAIFIGIIAHFYLVICGKNRSYQERYVALKLKSKEV